MAPMGEILKNSSNCHNFGCIQHRVVIFGSIQILPRPTLVAMATKFETKYAITRLV